jgi:hypothetical protein
MRFRTKPVVIEAVQFTQEMARGLKSLPPGLEIERSVGLDRFGVQTLEGFMTVSVGDWIIRGLKGEYYPCKPDIFDTKYEVACDHRGQDNQAVHWNPLNGIWQCHACGQVFAPIPEFTRPVLRPEEKI